MISGIYKIQNKISGRTYIGRSLDVKRRLIAHKTKLRANKHVNIYLQNSWNFYGEPCFVFGVILFCTVKESYRLEQVLIDYWKSNKLAYNIVDASRGGIKIFNKKVVHHIDFSGKRVSYDSLHDAARAIGVSPSSIWKWVNKKLVTEISNGQWFYDGEDPHYSPIKVRGKGVDCYDISGAFIKSYDSIVSAATDCSADANWIKKVAEGCGCTAGGFRWAMRGKDLDSRKNNKHDGSKRRKKIYHIDNAGSRRVFNGLKEAADYYDTSYGVVQQWLYGKRNCRLGSEWGYVKK